MKEKENEAIEANQKMDDLFNDFGSRNLIGDSEEETANHEIQEQFYDTFFFVMNRSENR